MPIISIDSVNDKIHKITFISKDNVLKNIIVTKDGLYSITYVKNGYNIHHTGKINIMSTCTNIAKNSYILFDYSTDNSNRMERIYLYQIKDILDVSPNNAYKIALEHGFVGTVEEWLEHMRGKSAYEIAVDYGFEGTIEDWIASNGDTTVLNQQVKEIQDHLEWKTTM